MRYAGYSSSTERQSIIDALPPNEIIIGEENINLDENGKPTVNRLIIEDYSAVQARQRDETADIPTASP